MVLGCPMSKRVRLRWKKAKSFLYCALDLRQATEICLVWSVWFLSFSLEKMSRLVDQSVKECF